MKSLFVWLLLAVCALLFVGVETTHASGGYAAIVQQQRIVVRNQRGSRFRQRQKIVQKFVAPQAVYAAPLVVQQQVVPYVQQQLVVPYVQQQIVAPQVQHYVAPLNQGCGCPNVF